MSETNQSRFLAAMDSDTMYQHPGAPVFPSVLVAIKNIP
jgi:hypothetical protein